jgi:mRNA-degrading endonuclease toxin of MazEF toxin-antitoxin module
MNKDFDTWNKLKKEIQNRGEHTYAYPREIWWCSLGINVGAEVDGKNENFERPVIVLKVYNKETMLVLPITSKEKNDRFHHMIQTEQKTVWVKLTQPRMISNKRLLRKVDVLDQDSFKTLLEEWKRTI